MPLRQILLQLQNLLKNISIGKRIAILILAVGSILGFVLLLVSAEKDLGTCIILTLVIFFMFIASGMKKRHLFSLILGFLPFLAFSIYKYPFNKYRNNYKIIFNMLF